MPTAVGSPCVKIQLQREGVELSDFCKALHRDGDCRSDGSREGRNG